MAYQGIPAGNLTGQSVVYTSPLNNLLASNYGVNPNNSDNTAAFNNLLAIARGSSVGARIWLDAGPHKFNSATTDPGGSPVELMGSGPGLTSFLADGSLLTSGNLLTPKRYFHAFNMTFGTTGTKAAGDLINVIGDMVIADGTAMMSYEFGNCNIVGAFNGVHLVDGAGSKGVCGFFWDGMYNHAHGLTAGGTLFLIDTPNGVVNLFQNVLHSETPGAADAARPAATCHILNAADFRLKNIEEVYTQRGLIIDPPASGTAATIFMTDCIWGQVTQEAIKIAPNASATCHTIESKGGYCDLGGLSITGSAVKGVTWEGMQFLGNSPNDAIKLDGVTGGANFIGIRWAGGNAKCFHALNSSTNFAVQGTYGNTFAINTVGVHIEAGCDKYNINVVGDAYCTTPVTEPSPGANRVFNHF